MQRIRNALSVGFYVRRKLETKRGEIPIFFRLIVNSVRVESSVGKKIKPELWSGEKGRAIKRTSIPENSTFISIPSGYG